MQACTSFVASCSLYNLSVLICEITCLQILYHPSARLYHYIPNRPVKRYIHLSIVSFGCHVRCQSAWHCPGLHIGTVINTPETLVYCTYHRHHHCTGQLFSAYITAATIINLVRSAGQLKNGLWLVDMCSTIHSTPLSFNIICCMAGGKALSFEQCTYAQRPA